MAYHLEGRILEVCDCNVLCPCWIGEDPDNGTCDAVLAYRIDKGTIEGIDVSGLTIASIVFIPGNIQEGNINTIFFVDENASMAQENALMKAWRGELGGPLADFAELTNEVITVERAPITFTVAEGKGTLQIGSGITPIVKAIMASYIGATGEPTTLVDSIFSTIPGSPAYVSKASTYRRNSSQYGLRDISLNNHNAVQGRFNFIA
jgi:hypothetical protein